MSSQRFPPLPTFFLGSTEANERITHFMDTKHPLLSADLGKTDTRSIWYDFTHIENLYKELVYLNADGLRIYFGAYAADHPDFAGQQCLIMVPTRYDEDDQASVDVIMEEDADFANRAGSAYLDEEEKALNYGAPCPTICPTVARAVKYPFPRVTL